MYTWVFYRDPATYKLKKQRIEELRINAKNKVERKSIQRQAQGKTRSSRNNSTGGIVNYDNSKHCAFPNETNLKYQEYMASASKLH